MFKKHIRRTLFALMVLGVASLASSTQTEAYYDNNEVESVYCNGEHIAVSDLVIDVDVPLSVTSYIDSDGQGVTSGSIANNSEFCIDMQVESTVVADNWTLKPYSEDFSTLPVNSKYLASKVYGEDIYDDPKPIIPIDDKEKIPFPCTVKIPPQTEVVNEKGLDVFFTVEPQIATVRFEYGEGYDSFDFLLSKTHPDINFRDLLEYSEYNTTVGFWYYDKDDEFKDHILGEIITADELGLVNGETVEVYPFAKYDMPHYYIKSGNNFRKALKGVAENITDIKFEWNYRGSEAYKNAPYKVDLTSEDPAIYSEYDPFEPNKVVGYMLEGDTTLYIESAGDIYLEEDASYMFSSYTDDASIPTLKSLKSIDFGLDVIDCAWSVFDASDTSYMFYGSKITNLDLRNLYIKTNNVVGMFKYCTELTELQIEEYGSLYPYGADSAESLFENCSSLVHADTLWLRKDLKSYCNTFKGCRSLETVELPDMCTMEYTTTMEGMFMNCSSLKEVDLTCFGSAYLKTMKNAFNGCSSLTSLVFPIESWEGSDCGFYADLVEDMSYAFFNCTSLETLDMKYFTTDSLKDASYAFGNCSSLKELTLDKFDFSNVTTADGTFAGCSGLTTLTLGDFNAPVLSSANAMFKDCSGLTELALGVFDAKSLVTGREMFSGCSKLTYLDLGNFTTPELKDISYMFNNCSELAVIDFELWDLTKVLANKANSVNTFAGMSGAIGHVAPAQLNNFVTYWGSEAEIKFVPSYSEVPNIKEYYTYSTKFGGYGLGLTGGFKAEVDKAEGGVFTDSLGNTWRTGDPLPNPGSRVNGVSGRKNIEAIIDTFGNLTNLVTIDLTKFDTRYNTNFRQLLRGCTSLKEVYMSGLDSSNVTITNDMFENCTALEKIDLRGMDMSNLPSKSYYQAFENATGVCLVSEEYLQDYLNLDFEKATGITFTSNPADLLKLPVISDSVVNNSEVEEPVIENEGVIADTEEPANEIVTEEQKVEEPKVEQEDITEDVKEEALEVPTDVIESIEDVPVTDTVEADTITSNEDVLENVA